MDCVVFMYIAHVYLGLSRSVSASGSFGAHHTEHSACFALDTAWMGERYGPVFGGMEWRPHA